MLSLSSIVVPIDGSDLSKTALPVGEQLARALGSTLTLLTSGWGSTVEELQAGLDAEAAKLDVPTAVSVVPDTFPATAIAHAVAGTDDAVVMATHGRSGIGKALLGSVAEDLLKVTERPVLLLGPSANPLPGHHRRRHGRVHRRRRHLGGHPPPRRPVGQGPRPVGAGRVGHQGRRHARTAPSPTTSCSP